MPLEGQAKKDYQKEYMKGKRSNTGSNKSMGLTQEGLTDVTLNPDDVRPGLIFPPSKVLSPEEDRKVQENVINTLKAMSGSRRQAFRGLANSFTPNSVKDPSLEIPDMEE